MQGGHRIGIVAALIAGMVGVTSASRAEAPPPDEAAILVEEVPHIADRVVVHGLPDDEQTVLDAVTTSPEGVDDVVAMHLERLHPTRDELTPGVAPLISLVSARAGLLTDPLHLTKKVEDLLDGEYAVVELPIDAVTAIVILPTQVVEADPDAGPLPERPVDLSDLTYEVNGRTRTIDDYLADGATNAIALMHDGALVYEGYQNGFTRDTRHHLWSATKSVTTALVGIAVGEGKVRSIHDPIEAYIPETVGTVWEGTTIEDLLQMESGIYWVDVPVHQPEELVAMGLDFHTNGLLGLTRNEYLLNLTRVSPAGEHYRYNSADPQMLTWLLENVYGEAYATILSEKLWQPAGMERDARIMVDREGHAFASMGLFATARDEVRFGELFRNGGRTPDGVQVVPEAWVRASHDHSEATGGPRGYMWPKWSHGYGAIGFGSQLLNVAPELDMVGIRFGNDPVDSIAPKEWEALYLAVAERLQPR